MKKFYSAIMLLVAFCAYSQLHVSTNSFVYASDRMLYVNQDIDLQPNANIYLRNESQLLQGTSSSSTNKGAGSVSVFQEGTVNNFSYNYWCSPVGTGSVALGNENFGISLLNRPTTATLSTPAVLLPTTVYDGIANPLSISTRWIYKFINSNTYAGWIAVNGANAVEPGLGFTMKGTSGTDAIFSDHGVTNNPGSKQRYDFRGKPNDGNINIPVQAGQRTLMGNPYSSAIDLNMFLNNATNITKTAYFWQHDTSSTTHLLVLNNGGYGTYIPGPINTMGVYNPATFYAYDGSGTQLGSVGTGTYFNRRFSPIGQGFMVEGTATGTLLMNNNVRVYVKEGSTSDFNRGSFNSTEDAGFLPEIQSVSGFDYTTVSTTPIPQIKLITLINDQGLKPLTLAFYPGSSDAAEYGMDGKPFDVTATDINFLIGDSEYVIDMFEFSTDKKVPLGFRNTNPATFKIAVSEYINFNEIQNVYVHDKLNNSFHNIKEDSYEVQLPAGGNSDRYEITFTADDVLVNSDFSESAANFDAVQNNQLHLLSVLNPKNIDVKSVALYDITGKLIFDQQKPGIKTKYEISTAGLSDAIYILKVTSAKGLVFSKKISVYNLQ